jgi:hypothetical protein
VCLFRHNIYKAEEQELHILHKEFLILDKLKKIKIIEEQMKVCDENIKTVFEKKSMNYILNKKKTFEYNKQKLLEMVENFY